MNSDSLLLWSKQFALVWFFLMFVGILIWVYWPGKKNSYDETANTILDDDDLDQHHKKDGKKEESEQS